LDSDEPARRITDGTVAVTARDAATGGYYLFVIRGGQLSAQPFDLDRLTLSGEPYPFGAAEQVSASDNGVLAIQRGNTPTAVLAWYNQQGTAMKSLAPERAHGSVDLSPDGSTVALSIGGDLWLRDLVRGTSTRFTTDPGSETIAIWSPAGDRVVFSSSGRDARPSKLYIKPSNGATAEELLLSTDDNVWGNDWSRDGRFLLYSQGGKAPSMHLWVLPMDQPAESRKPIPYLGGPLQKKQAQFSPDGRFVAYASNESGRFEVYVQPFPDPTAGKWPISSGGGVEPRWSKDGSQLFYFSGKKLMAVNVETKPAFRAGAPRELFETQVQAGYTNDGHRWRVAPDGTFLMETFPPELSANSITVIVNWPEFLKKRVPIEK
jgi:hypothetical protein